MITQEQFNNLKVGDILKNSINEIEVCLKSPKVLIVIGKTKQSDTFSLEELNRGSFEIKPSIKYNQGFEIRKYPERPVVLVGDVSDDVWKLRFLVEVTENNIKTISEGFGRFHDSYFTVWEYIKKVD